MSKKIAQTTLNASTIDILNVIRQNANYEYQSSVPVITKASDIPAVGEIIYGTPALQNTFLNAIVNRIALVRVKSVTFNNPYSVLKKGYLEFGETVENIFVEIAKVVYYTPEEANEREFKRTIPDVKSVFHTINWRVVYPVTIQDDALKQAFLSLDGVTNLIENIINQVYTAANYDEFLLFKYMLIKAVSHGKLKPVSIGDGTDLKKAGAAMRSISNKFTFMSNKYNEAGVTTATPKENQIIFMDTDFDAEFDTEVLASAFNLDKATYLSRRFLIDDFTEFNNDRFKEIRAKSDGLEEVTAEELALMKNVKAIALDEDWFQVYDNNNKFTETYVASSLYWNYFYHTWKTVSHSPFANAVVFVTDNAEISVPDSLTVEITGKDHDEVATVLTLGSDAENASLKPDSVLFVQDETSTKAGIAIQPYGAVIIPATAAASTVTLKATVDGTSYTAAETINSASNVGDTVTLNKD